MKKIILTALCLSMSLMFSSGIALGSEDPFSDLHEQFMELFPDKESVMIHYGAHAKWEKSAIPSPHDENLELTLSRMEFPGVEIRTMEYPYEGETHFSLILVHVKEGDSVDFLGIGIGSAKADVIKRFGESFTSEGNKLTYENESGYTEIVFTIEENKVVEMAFNNYPD